MKRFGFSVVLALVLVLLLAAPATVSAQGQPKKVALSLKASVMQRLGVDTDITIEYSRPVVKGREIWGKLIPWGMNPGEKYSDNKPYPWRAGANEMTTILVSKDVEIEGKTLPAGKYGIHMIPGEKEFVVIFSKTSAGWGSYKYNKDEDALRVTVAPVKAPHQECLLYGFDDLAGTAATGFLHWETVKVPFKIKALQ
jgi:hypothetical protein